MKIHQGKFILILGRIIKRVDGHWNRFPREMVTALAESTSVWMMLLIIWFRLN